MNAHCLGQARECHVPVCNRIGHKAFCTWRHSPKHTQCGEDLEGVCDGHGYCTNYLVDDDDEGVDNVQSDSTWSSSGFSSDDVECCTCLNKDNFRTRVRVTRTDQAGAVLTVRHRLEVNNTACDEVGRVRLAFLFAFEGPIAIQSATLQANWTSADDVTPFALTVGGGGSTASLATTLDTDLTDVIPPTGVPGVFEFETVFTFNSSEWVLFLNSSVTAQALRPYKNCPQGDVALTVSAYRHSGLASQTGVDRYEQQRNILEAARRNDSAQLLAALGVRFANGELGYGIGGTSIGPEVVFSVAIKPSNLPLWYLAIARQIVDPNEVPITKIGQMAIGTDGLYDVFYAHTQLPVGQEISFVWRYGSTGQFIVPGIGTAPEGNCFASPILCEVDWNSRVIAVLPLVAYLQPGSPRGFTVPSPLTNRIFYSNTFGTVFNARTPPEPTGGFTSYRYHVTVGVVNGTSVPLTLEFDGINRGEAEMIVYDNLVLAGAIPPMVIVMANNPGNSTNYRRDYTYSTLRLDLYNHTIAELLPQVQADLIADGFNVTLRTDSNSRAALGTSYGCPAGVKISFLPKAAGVAADPPFSRIGMIQPSVSSDVANSANAAIAYGSGFLWNPLNGSSGSELYLSSVMMNYWFGVRPRQNIRIHLVAGGYDFMNQGIQNGPFAAIFANVLRMQNYQYKFVFFPTAGHGSKYDTVAPIPGAANRPQRTGQYDAVRPAQIAYLWNGYNTSITVPSFIGNSTDELNKGAWRIKEFWRDDDNGISASWKVLGGNDETNGNFLDN